ncbi:hypothetical protein IE4771_PA00019 (plasmid) [Rhizobium etli bv. mimosae str. IE4771]|uniref:Abasic site processing protein n=1 Tax=Rhizobium etli bv. mimosae str. IE4771 TaxID=1432050 RepID=A0A060IBQ7_RHIET|nr:hypothetical protein IE4771_PA00019 [Rhizobium sp. IE4771]
MKARRISKRVRTSRSPMSVPSSGRSTGSAMWASWFSGAGAGRGRTSGPVYNFRSEGREFASNRCLIIADGFYEFTDPKDPKKKRKDKWLFTKKDEPIFCIAGIWRETPEVGQAFTMLTMEPGPDIAPYHDRQIVILERGTWADWLDPAISAKSLIKPLPVGTLSVEQVG